MQVEDRPSVFSLKNDQMGHHQFKESGTPHHLSRWNQPRHQQEQIPAQVQAQSRPQPQQSGSGYVIPVIVEGKDQRASGGMSPTPAHTQVRMVPSDNQRG